MSKKTLANRLRQYADIIDGMSDGVEMRVEFKLYRDMSIHALNEFLKLAEGIPLKFWSSHTSPTKWVTGRDPSEEEIEITAFLAEGILLSDLKAEVTT